MDNENDEKQYIKHRCSRTHKMVVFDVLNAHMYNAKSTNNFEFSIRVTEKIFIQFCDAQKFRSFHSNDQLIETSSVDSKNLLVGKFASAYWSSVRNCWSQLILCLQRTFTIENSAISTIHTRMAISVEHKKMRAKQAMEIVFRWQFYCSDRKWNLIKSRKKKLFLKFFRFWKYLVLTKNWNKIDEALRSLDFNWKMYIRYISSLNR